MRRFFPRPVLLEQQSSLREGGGSEGPVLEGLSSLSRLLALRLLGFKALGFRDLGL